MAGMPNIIVVLSDDQGAWALGCAGNREIRTPIQDRLAREGMRFENFFCTSPVCSPARATLLTGRIPSQHGVHDWIRTGNLDDPNGTFTWGGVADRAIEYLAGIPAYTDFLAARGYACGMCGKWHLGDAIHPQKSFAWWFPHAWGGGPYYGAPLVRNGVPYREPRYVTDAITEGALEFLDWWERGPHASGQPFYLSVHYTAPHSPWDRDNHPRELYDSYRQGCAFISTPDEPPHPWQVPSEPSGTGERRKDLLSGYFSAITAMDTGIGRILEAVESRGIRKNTLVVFTSDNGMNMGHHGIWGKGDGTFPLNMYDTSVKVPLIVSMPGTVPEGRVSGELLSQYDVLPTLAGFVGITVEGSASLPGRSFVPLLRGAPMAGHTAVVVFDEYGPVRMVRTHEWKYVHRYPYGPHALYSLTEDPEERTNLYEHAREHPLAVGQIVTLKACLDEWFTRFADPAMDGSREGVTGGGQIGPAGTAGMGQPAYYTGGWWHGEAGRSK